MMRAGTRFGFGVSLIAMWVTTTHAQDRTVVQSSPPEASPQDAAPTTVRRQTVTRGADGVFRDAQGQPLPPDMQRRFKERLRDTPPAATAPGETSAQDAAPTTVRRQTVTRGADGVFRDAQGQPLPPDMQRQFEERLRGTPPATTPPPTTDGDITVTGERPRGSVIGDLPPERRFSAIDVRAFGATDIGELLETIAPQIRSNRGREDAGPVTLLNGRRVSSFQEIARIPTEAIERMDVFPEELALRYGFRADQKVVNVVTFPNFSSTVGQAIAFAPTDGGTATGGVTADQLVLRGDTRLGLGASYNRTGALLESERDLIQPGGDATLGDTRTLLPRVERFALNGVVGAPLTREIGAALNAQFETSDLRALLGADADGAIVRDTRTHRGRLGTVLDGRTGRWLWSLTGGYDRTANETFTDTLDPSARDRIRSVNALAEADLVMSGPLLSLPAGPLTASVGGGLSARAFRGQSLSGDDASLTTLGRDRAVARFSLDAPITRRADGGIGELSANANVEVERLSDFDTLRTIGAGLAWSPVESVSLVTSITQEEGAPTVEQLGAPTIVTPNARIFDFATGAVVDVARSFGGNPDLRADNRRVVRIGLHVAPIPRTDLSFSLDYVDTRIDDLIAAFPIPTPALEAAFPDRFQRDAAGRLVAIDARPVNFARSTLRQLRTGVSFSRPLGDPTAGLPPGSVVQQTRSFGSQAEAEAFVRRRYPGSTIVFSDADPGSPAARRGETMRSRFYVNLYHSWTLADTVTLADGGDALDRLDGFATDLRGGRRRHQIEFQLGAFKRGLGGRLGVTWQSATRIDGLGADQLRFDDIGRVDLSLFVNPAERLGGTSAPDWIKRTRVTLSINNLFDQRPQVRDTAGATPIAFQPTLLDPLGRTVSLTLRKTF